MSVVRRSWAECNKRPRGHSQRSAGVRPHGAPVHRHHLVRPKQHDDGIVSPRAWAVLRLMTSSNFIGCSTGRSAGLVPLRSLST